MTRERSHTWFELEACTLVMIGIGTHRIEILDGQCNGYAANVE